VARRLRRAWLIRQSLSECKAKGTLARRTTEGADDTEEDLSTNHTNHTNKEVVVGGSRAVGALKRFSRRFRVVRAFRGSHRNPFVWFVDK
jgi:hypothetical protein